MIKAIIFDMDGVLIDSELYFQTNLQNHLKHYGITASMEDLLPIVGGTQQHYDMVLNPFLKKANISREEFDSYSQNFYINNPTPYKTLLNPHVEDVLKWLKQRNYKIAIASSSKMHEIKEFLDTCNLKKYFDLIMSGEMFIESKPNPEIYIVCVEKLNLQVNECIAVEDSEYGIIAAKKAQLLCIAKQDHRFQNNQKYADYHINDLIEIIQIIKEVQ